MYSNAYNIYKNNSVNYASKDQLLLMLVDGAVKFVKRAKIDLEEKDFKSAHEHLIKTQNIFTELKATIDLTAGEWANNMYNIYGFINSKLVESNMKKDQTILDEVIPLIEEVRDIWYEAQRLSVR